MSGDIHISNTGLWSVIPDVAFLNLKEFVENGLQLQGKYLGITRLPQPKTLDDLATVISTFFMLISKEVSQEVVIDELCTRIVNRIPKMIALIGVVNIYLSKNCSTRLRTKLLSNLTIANSIPNVSKTLITIKRVLFSKLIASICFAPHLIAFLIGLLNTSSELIVPKSSLPRPVADFSRNPNATSNGNRIITASRLKKS